MPSDSANSPAPEATAARGSRLISRLLPPAIRLWLHSQLDHIEGLEFAIDGKDRQILGGYLPGVNLAAQQAVYQGLHVSQVQVSATEIRVNLPQVLRGKPLRLLQPFPVGGRVMVLAADLQASLQSPLLGQGLRDVLAQLLAGAEGKVDLGQWLRSGDSPAAVEVALGADRLTLRWPSDEPGAEVLELVTGLAMQEGRWLCLWEPVVTVVSASEQVRSPIPLSTTRFDLGPEVDIQQLSVTSEGIELVGVVRVIPAD